MWVIAFVSTFHTPRHTIFGLKVMKSSYKMYYPHTFFDVPKSSFEEHTIRALTSLKSASKMHANRLFRFPTIFVWARSTLGSSEPYTISTGALRLSISTNLCSPKRRLWEGPHTFRNVFSTYYFTRMWILSPKSSTYPLKSTLKRRSEMFDDGPIVVTTHLTTPRRSAMVVNSWRFSSSSSFSASMFVSSHDKVRPFASLSYFSEMLFPTWIVQCCVPYVCVRCSQKHHVV
jgi:hypothetical protein